MKKILAIACATSALALASGAYADVTVTGTSQHHSTSINLSATVQSSCTLSIPIATDTGAGSNAKTTPTADFDNVNFSYSNIVNSSSFLIGASGYVRFPVTTTGSCNFELSASKGALDAGGSKVIPYGAGLSSTDVSSAQASAVSATPSAAALNGLQFTPIPVSNVGLNGVADVWVAFNIPADTSGTSYQSYPGGTYTDTLTLKMTPAS
jgi:hypothetical protein